MLGRLINLHSGRWRKSGVQISQVVSHQSAFLARCLWPNRLPETSAYLEVLRLSQHVVARPCELVRQRLDRQDAIALALLACIKTLGLRTATQSEVRRLHKCPGQVLVPVLRVAFPLLLAIALPKAVHAAAVGSEIS